MRRNRLQTPSRAWMSRGNSCLTGVVPPPGSLINAGAALAVGFGLVNAIPVQILIGNLFSQPAGGQMIELDGVFPLPAGRPGGQWLLTNVCFLIQTLHNTPQHLRNVMV